MRTVPGFRYTSSNAFNLIARTAPGFRYTSREAFYLIARTIPGFRFTSSKAFYLITTGDAPVRMLPTFPNSIFWTLYPVFSSTSHWSRRRGVPEVHPHNRHFQLPVFPNITMDIVPSVQFNRLLATPRFTPAHHDRSSSSGTEIPKSAPARALLPDGVAATSTARCRSDRYQQV